MSEQQVLASLSAANVRAHVEEICRNIPTRLAGTENGRRMAGFSERGLHEAGVAARIHEIPGLVSFPGPTELRVLSPVELTIPANTLGHSEPTPPGGVHGELLDVASGAYSEYEGKDAAGKITLSELSYHPARHEKQRISGIKGAAGCVMMNWGHPENTALPFGSVKPVWGNPTPETLKTEMATLPCIGISRTDGLKLREMAARGPVRVSFQASVENVWRPVQITVGKIPGGGGNDFVIVGGHQDSWPGEQATDNAAGNACIIELARVFNQHRSELRRGLTFGFWAGHETGTMIGSTWYVDRHWDDLRRHAVAYLQIDQPACAGTTRWTTASNVELRRFHQGIERRLLGNRAFSWKRAVKTGDSSFFGLGIPMFAGLGAFTEEELKATALANLGWWHHSVENTLDKLDWEYMADHLRVYGAYLWELCTAPVLPFEFVGVADQFVERLSALCKAGESVGIPSALETARSFREAAHRLDEAAEHWRGRYAKGGLGDNGPASILNECMKRLSRTLIPLQSTEKGTYGHDPYGYTPQGTMIPALYEVPALERVPAEGEERWMLETLLVRQRNRVADALADGCDLIDETLTQLD